MAIEYTIEDIEANRINAKYFADGRSILVDDVGTIFYFKHAILHRDDGPAVEYANGYKVWYLNGKRYIDKIEWFDDLPEDKKEDILFRIYEIF